MLSIFLLYIFGIIYQNVYMYFASIVNQDMSFLWNKMNSAKALVFARGLTVARLEQLLNSSKGISRSCKESLLFQRNN